MKTSTKGFIIAELGIIFNCGIHLFTDYNTIIYIISQVGIIGIYASWLHFKNPDKIGVRKQ